ncbi:putative Se/S carrier-like protein [Agathobaculum butyriciproducens]
MALPVPRRLSAGCGIAWRMEAEVYAQYQTVIADCGIEIEQSEAFVF